MKRLFFLIVLVFLVPNNSYAVSYNSDPKIFITELVNDAIKTLSDKSLTEGEKNKVIKKIALENVDIKALGLYALGEFRKTIEEEKAREIATSLGSVLAKKLKLLEKSSKGTSSSGGGGSGGLKKTYTVTMRHFSTKDSLKVLQALKKAPGYSSHDTISKASGVRKYSYETTSSSSDLEEVILEKLMELKFDLDNDIDINIKGNKIIMENLKSE